MSLLKNNLAFSRIKTVIILLVLSLFIVSGYFYYTHYYKHSGKTGLNGEDQFPAIKVILLNGCGYQGVANYIMESLGSKNIDVDVMTNTRKFIYKETIIVVKKNDKNELERLKAMTGIQKVIYALNESSSVPFYIIAGKDYLTYFQK